MKKFKFTIVKKDDELFITRYCEHGQEEWQLVREALQPIAHHSNILNKEPFQSALDDIVRQRTVTLFLSDEEAAPYMDETYTSGSFSDELIVVDESSPSGSSQTDSHGASSQFSTNDFQQVIQNMFKLQMESFQSLISSFQQTMAPMSSVKNRKMEVNKFNGKLEDAKTWLIGYERACEFNGWSSEDAKINNLKAYLEGIALKWFNSRLIEDLPMNWSSWREAFLEAFGQNRVTQAQTALAWEYRGGPLLEYFYEKQRLLQLAFPELTDFNFITLTLLTLPDELQKQIVASEINSKEELRRALTQLKPFRLRDKEDRPRKQQHTQRPKKEAEKIFNVQNSPSSLSSSSNMFEVIVNGEKVKALFDTGSSVDLVSSVFLKANEIPTLDIVTELRAFDGEISTYNKQATLDITFKDKKLSIHPIVTDKIPYELVLGIKSLKELKLHWDIGNNTVCTILSSGVNSVSSLAEAKKYFPSLFDQTPSDPKLVCDFKLIDEAPVIQAKPYRLSRDKYIWAKEKINELLANRIIQPSTSEYASPCVIVPKESGALRLCQDYREINKHTIQDPFPFPVIDDIINGFGGCELFTKIDLKDGFWQVGLSPETRKFSAFVLPFGHYELLRLPFGWKNSPAIFQRELSRVLGDLVEMGRVALYIDDICIGGLDAEECSILTAKVLKRLASNGIKVNEQKCEFGAQSVTFLGRVIDGYTKTTRQESIERVKNMKRPTELHTLRCFTGLTGHFRSYIPKYADIVRPLDKLKQKDQAFEWSEECELAYQELVKQISSNPILATPDWRLPFELSCDASYYGTGAILYQRDVSQSRNKQLRVIGYFSYTFTKPELNYTVTEKECLSVIKAIKYFRSYIEGKNFIVHTDHQALSHLMSLKEPKNRLGRWQTFLMSFNLKINHRSGRELTDADAISRLCPTIPEVNNIVELADKRRIRIKPEQVSELLRNYHDDPISGGHDGISRTYHKISARFYWDGMKKDIADYVRSCDVCQKIKAKFRPSSDPIIIPEQSKIFFEVIHLDYGELKKKSESIARTRSFLIVVDEATRLCQAVPMKEDSSSLIEFLRAHPLLHLIKKIISDNGKSFTAQPTLKFARAHGIQMKTTSPFSPWSNGLAERYVQKIKTFCELFPDFPGGWRKAVEAGARHNNRAYNRALGCSPFYKAFNRVDLLEADKTFGVQNNIELIEFPFSEETQNNYRQKVQQYANKNVKPRAELKPGNLILVFRGNLGKQRKLFGPFKIVKIHELSGYPKTIIYDDNGMEKVAHIRNVRRYHPRSDSSQ